MTDTDAERMQSEHVERLARVRAEPGLKIRRAGADQYARWEIRNARGELIAETCAGWPADQNEANALLFAAAPDLLAAAEAALGALEGEYGPVDDNDFGGGHLETSLMEKLQAAIQKAKGGA